MKKIQTLTSEQEKQLVDFRAEWLAIGLSTERVNKKSTARVLIDFYDRIDERPPKFWFCDSPFQAQVVMNLFKRDSLRDNMRASLWDNLGDNLRDNLENSLGDNLGVSLQASLWASLEASLRDNLRANLWDNLWGNLEANLGGSLGANLWVNLRDNMRASLWDNLQDNLGDNLRANLWVNLRDNLEVNLGANLGDNLGDNLRASLGDNLGASLWGNLGDSLGDNLGDNLRDNLEDNLQDNLRANLEYVSTYLWGSSDSYWIAYYLYPHQFLRPIFSPDDAALLEEWGELAKSCFWFYPFKDICFVCDRPTAIHKDEQNRLHNENGAAVSFLDSWNTYCWHGVNIPPEWIEQKDKLTPEIALTWRNVEQRNAACQILGWDKILSALDAKVIHKDPNPYFGTLLEADLPDQGPQRFLRAKCGTGRDVVVLVSDMSAKTARAAGASTYRVSEEDYNPTMRT